MSSSSLFQPLSDFASSFATRLPFPLPFPTAVTTSARGQMSMMLITTTSLIPGSQPLQITLYNNWKQLASLLLDCNPSRSVNYGTIPFYTAWFVQMYQNVAKSVARLMNLNEERISKFQPWKGELRKHEVAQQRAARTYMSLARFQLKLDFRFAWNLRQSPNEESLYSSLHLLPYVRWQIQGRYRWWL